jgi:hypothetical protein
MIPLDHAAKQLGTFWLRKVILQKDFFLFFQGSCSRGGKKSQKKFSALCIRVARVHQPVVPDGICI